MRSFFKKVGTFILIMTLLALTTGCGGKTVGKTEDFSGVWEGPITVEGVRMPGKMVLELDRSGKGSVRFGFVDQLTQESISVELNKEYGLKGEGPADQMHFNYEGKFYKMDEEWVFAGNLVINDGYQINDTTVEFFREGSESIPDLSGEIGYSEEMSPETWGNSIDFSGEWTGIQLLAEVSGTDAQEYKDMEGLTTDCRLVLSLPNYGTGTAQLQFDNDLAGPELTAAAAHDSLVLGGLLWGDSFEWSGTFEYDKAAESWTLTGGGDVNDSTAGATFHIVLSLNLTSADAHGQQPQSSAPNNQVADIRAPLDEFLIGSWMAPPSNVMTERKVLIINSGGAIKSYYATPGVGDTEETWVGGSWKLDEPIPGTWRVDGNKLIAEFENDSISFETDVRVIDADSIEIEVFYTRSEYHRLPVS